MLLVILLYISIALLVSSWFITDFVAILQRRMQQMQNDLLEVPTLEGKDLFEIPLKWLFNKLIYCLLVGSLVCCFSVAFFSSIL